MTRWPDLSVLELLVAVREHGSLSAAARACGMAQPNASRLVGHLEQRIGLALLVRNPRGSTLTEDGQLVVEWAKQVLDAAEMFNESVAALGAKGQDHLALGASLTIAEYLLPKWLSRFRQDHPDAELALEIHNSQEIFDRLSSGQLDLGFVESYSLRHGLYATPVSSDQLVVVVAPDHPWAERDEPLTVQELGQTPLVMREEGSGTREFTDRLLAPHDPVEPALVVNSNASVKVGVAAGVAPALLSRLAVETQLQSGDLMEVALEEPITRTLHAVWAKPRRPVGAVAELIQIARRLR